MHVWTTLVVQFLFECNKQYMHLYILEGNCQERSKSELVNEEYCLHLSMKNMKRVENFYFTIIISMEYSIEYRVLNLLYNEVLITSSTWEKQNLHKTFLREW